MKSAVGTADPTGKRIFDRASLHRVAGPAVVAFGLAMLIAYLPNMVQVFGIHNDYEMLRIKHLTFWHSEADHLLLIARPVAALLSNVPIWPIQDLADLRWTRLFSVLTVCVLGAQLMALSVHRLRIDTVTALGVALVAFMVPPFIYSVLNVAAWAPHLVSILIAFVAYAELSRSNVQLLSFLAVDRPQGARSLARHVLAYCRVRSVWLACLIYLLAFFDYPPNGLILTLFPVVAMLFSKAPFAYRRLLALRDLCFIAVTMVLYAALAKLVYLPILRLLASPLPPPDPSINPFAARVAPTYQMSFNTDIGESFARLGEIGRLSADLWFLPQWQFHLATAAVVVLAIVGANLFRSGPAGDDDALARLKVAGWTSQGPTVASIVAASFMIAASPVLLAGGGLVTYRTVPIPTAIAAIVFLYAAATIVRLAWRVAGASLPSATRAASVAILLIAVAAGAANFHANYLTMILARNEFAYFTGIVQAALRNNSRTIVLYDARSMRLPEDLKFVHDRAGRAVPPYELGCLSGFCFQTGAIGHIAAERLGLAKEYFTIFPSRPGDPFKGIDCTVLTARVPDYPDDISQRHMFILKWLERLRPLTCVNYDHSWHDVGIRLDPSAVGR